MDQPSSETLRRCPRCETEKHRNEFSSNGYCRPCSKAYWRSKNAERSAASKVKRPPAEALACAITPTVEALRDTPSGKEHLQTVTHGPDRDPDPVITTVADVVRNAEARKALCGTPRPALIREAAPVAKPVRRLRVTRELAEALVRVLEDGERLSLIAVRCGSALVIDEIEVCGVEL